MRANIMLAPDTCPEGVLIVRLDNSDYVACGECAEGSVFDAKGSIICGLIPPLWTWLRLWWRLRAKRKQQLGMAIAAIRMETE